MIDLDYYKLKASDESELTTKGFDIKLALRDLITDVERELKANPVENRVSQAVSQAVPEPNRNCENCLENIDCIIMKKALIVFELTHRMQFGCNQFEQK